MFNALVNFFKSHISIVISVISLSLSLYNFLYSLYSHHKKLNIDLITYKTIKDKNIYTYTFCVNISNCSQLPISITSMCVNNIFCAHNKKYFKRERYKEGKYTMVQQDTFTFQFPVNLSSLESTSGYIEFSSDKEINFDNITFKVFTNRGCIKKLTPTKLNFIDDEDTSF